MRTRIVFGKRATRGVSAVAVAASLVLLAACTSSPDSASSETSAAGSSAAGSMSTGSSGAGSSAAASSGSAAPDAAGVGPTTPATTTYPAEQQVASLTSPPLSAFGDMIMETSWNTGANAMLCLLAADADSTNCEDGLEVIHEQTDKAGLDPAGVVLVDGQGKDPASVTATQMANWMAWSQTQPWGAQLTAGLPIYGETGSLAAYGLDNPAKGKVIAKTGTSAGADPGTGRVIFGVQAMSGFTTTDQGRNLVLSLYMSGATYPDITAGLSAATPDVAEVAAFQQAVSQ